MFVETESESESEEPARKNTPKHATDKKKTPPKKLKDLPRKPIKAKTATDTDASDTDVSVVRAGNKSRKSPPPPTLTKQKPPGGQAGKLPAQKKPVAAAGRPGSVGPNKETAANILELLGLIFKYLSCLYRDKILTANNQLVLIPHDISDLGAGPDPAVQRGQL